MLVKREVILAKVESVYRTDAAPFATDQAGYQGVDVGGAKTGASATGLANDATAYTASISIDGTPNAVSVVGSAAQTYTELLAEINTDLSGAVATIVSGDIRVTSSSTGPSSSIAITDTDLFSTLTDFASVETAVAGEYSSAMLVEEPNWAHEGARMIQRNPVNQSLAPYKQIYGGSLKTVSFNVELKGPGAAYSSTVRPEIDPLFRGCGLAATVVTTGGSETCTYEPASTGHESITIYYYQDGTRHILTGCRGNVSFTCEAGGRVMAAFTFTGHWSTVTDTALPTPTYDTTVPPVFLSASFSTASFGAIIGALNFDLSNSVVTPPDVNQADGFGEIQITMRDVNGSFDPEHELIATHDFIGRWTAGTEGVISTGNIGSTQYNRFLFSFPVTYYRDVAPGDRDGIRTLDIPFGAVEDSGDDEISIIFS